MRIFVGYQDIDSGAKVATEHLLESFQKITPHSEFVVYKQSPYRFSGFLAFTKNFLWSITNFIGVFNRTDGPIDAVYSPYYLLFFALLFSKHRKTPFYFHLHGNQAEITLPLQKKHTFDVRYWYTAAVNMLITSLQKHVLHKANRVFFVSQEARDHFLKHYRLHLQPKTSVIVPNGVSLTKFFPLARLKKSIQKKKILKNTDGLVLLYVGRIDHKKGILELIESLSQIQTQKKIYLIIVHPDIPDKYSQRYLNLLRAATAHAPAQIIFRKKPRDIVSLYQIADLVLLPSYQEMMPLVMLEAFACGVPFIGSAAGNMGKILQRVDRRLVLSQITPAYIARAVNWFLSLPGQQQTALIEREKKIAGQFSWEKSAEKIITPLVQFSQSRHQH